MKSDSCNRSDEDEDDDSMGGWGMGWDQHLDLQLKKKKKKFAPNPAIRLTYGGIERLDYKTDNGLSSKGLFNASIHKEVDSIRCFDSLHVTRL